MLYRMRDYLGLTLHVKDKTTGTELTTILPTATLISSYAVQNEGLPSFTLHVKDKTTGTELTTILPTAAFDQEP